MRLRKFLVWTAVGLFVANVFALPHTLAALGVHAGGDGSRTVMVGQENPITCKADSVTFTTVRQAQYK
jgi:hypothetical protein